MELTVQTKLPSFSKKTKKPKRQRKLFKPNCSIKQYTQVGSPSKNEQATEISPEEQKKKLLALL